MDWILLGRQTFVIAFNKVPKNPGVPPIDVLFSGRNPLALWVKEPIFIFCSSLDPPLSLLLSSRVSSRQASIKAGSQWSEAAAFKTWDSLSVNLRGTFNIWARQQFIDEIHPSNRRRSCFSSFLIDTAMGRRGKTRRWDLSSLFYFSWRRQAREDRRASPTLTTGEMTTLTIFDQIGYLKRLAGRLCLFQTREALPPWWWQGMENICHQGDAKTSPGSAEHLWDPDLPPAQLQPLAWRSLWVFITTVL